MKKEYLSSLQPRLNSIMQVPSSAGRGGGLRAGEHALNAGLILDEG